MALSAVEIFKLLPKTNCRECGFSTCLAFASNLAAGKIELSACPYVSEEAKAKLGELAEPPVKSVCIGKGDNELKVGGETIMFRHEKRFENPPGLAMLIIDTMDDEEIEARIKRFQAIRFQRLGIVLRPELIAARCDSGDIQKFTTLVHKITQNSDAGIILMSQDPDVLAAGLKVCSERKPLIYAAISDNMKPIADLAEQYSCPVAVKGSSLEELVELTPKLIESGIKNIILDSGSRTLRQAFEDQVSIRRAAIYRNFQPLRYPTIVFPCEMAADPSMETLMAALFIARFGGIVVLSDFQGETIFPLLLERLDIFSDPQQPLMAPEGIYEIGKPDKNSPVLLTSSWAITYHNLLSAVEESGIPAFICVERIEEETDVMCWCNSCLRSTHPGQLNVENTSRFVNENGIENRINHRKLIIPGRTSQNQASLEKVLPEWEIIVGPTDPARLKEFLPAFTEKLNLN